MIILIFYPFLGNVESKITHEDLEVEVDNAGTCQYPPTNIEYRMPDNIDYVYDLKIRRSPNPYKFISDRHTILSRNIANGHKTVAYWKRIRSRTWNAASNIIQVEIIVVLVFIL